MVVNKQKTNKIILNNKINNRSILFRYRKLEIELEFLNKILLIFMNKLNKIETVYCHKKLFRKLDFY